MSTRVQGVALLLLAAAVVMAAAWLGGSQTLDLLDVPRNMDTIRSSLGELEALDGQRQQMMQAKQELQTRIDSAGQADADSRKALESLAAELEQVRMLSQQTALEGPGVRITVTDADREFIEHSGLGTDLNFFIVHDRDVLRILNALWGAGAEAIAVNGERLKNGDAVRCVGPSILVGSRRLTPPFVIEAIGDGQTLEKALSGGRQALIYEELTAFGIGFDIEIVDRLVVPAASPDDKGGIPS